MEKDINNGIELIQWIEKNDLLLRINDNEAATIMDTLNSRNSKLFYQDKNEKLLQQGGSTYTNILNNSGALRHVTIDDVIDDACEINYEDLETAIKNYEITKLNFVSKEHDGLEKLLQLHMQKKILEDAFQKTIYKRKMEEALRYKKVEDEYQEESQPEIKENEQRNKNKILNLIR